MDSLRRWGWVSSLAALAPLVGAVLIAFAGAGAWGLILLAIVVSLMACALPFGALTPRLVEPDALRNPISQSLPTLLAVAASSAAIAIVGPEPGVLEPGLAALLAILALWTRRAPGLANLLALPAAALIAVIGSQVFHPGYADHYLLFVSPWAPAVVLGLTLAALAEIATRRIPAPSIAALALAALPGAALLGMDFAWDLRAWLGAYNVALMAMGLAAAYTLLTIHGARLGQAIWLALGVCGAYAMIALALTALISGIALTVALGVLMVSAAAMDRRWPIPALGLVIAAAAAGLLWRLLVDPGLMPLIVTYAADRASLLEALLTVLVIIGAPLAVLALWRAEGSVLRAIGRAGAESMLSISLPIGVLILAYQLFETFSFHAMAGVQVGVIVTMMMIRVRRAQAQTVPLMRIVRIAVAIGQGIAVTLLLVTLLALAHPVWGLRSESVLGVVVLNDLLLGYLLPALAFGLAARDVARFRRPLWALSGLFAALWVQAALRHLWVGAAAMPIDTGFRQAELYSYTVALLLAGALGMAMALRWQSHGLRRVALWLIGLAAAKALLIDGSELSGLLRVGAFLSIGLSLVALAWLNGWATRRIGRDQEGPDDGMH